MLGGGEGGRGFFGEFDGFELGAWECVFGEVDEAVDEADAAGVVCGDEVRVEEAFACGAWADGEGEEVSVDGGADAEFDDGVAEGRVLVGDDEVGGGEECASAGDGGGVGGDDDGLGGAAEGARGGGEGAEHVGEGAGVFTAEGEIEAGAESGALAADEDGAAGGIVGEGACVVVEGAEHLRREGVAFPGAVEDDLGDGCEAWVWVSVEADHRVVRVRAKAAASARRSGSTVVVYPASWMARTRVSVAMLPGAGLSFVPA